MHRYIDQILKDNKEFVENENYKNYITTKFPTKKIAILSCMDTRLTELLPAALNFKNGDVKIIKNAGAVKRDTGTLHLSCHLIILYIDIDNIIRDTICKEY